MTFDPHEMLSRLKAHVSQVMDRYLVQHKDSTSGPEVWGADVKACSILTHAALEEFFEDLSLGCLAQAIDSWLTQTPLTRPIACLMATYGREFAADYDDHNPPARIFDRVRNTLGAAKTQHSSLVSNNHGVDFVYLEKLLAPVGIDYDTDVRLSEALKHLVLARGSFAHGASADASYTLDRSRRGKTVAMSPEDCRKHVEDCLEYSTLIVDRVGKAYRIEASLVP